MRFLGAAIRGTALRGTALREAALREAALRGAYPPDWRHAAARLALLPI